MGWGPRTEDQLKNQSDPMNIARMLERVGADPALIGDLLEEYERGAHSRTWYSKQVVSILMRQILSSTTGAARWMCTLPVALVAAGLIPYVVLVAQSRLAPNVSASAAVMMPITSFLMAAVFVSASVWVAPDRKSEVSRIAVAVVAFWGVAFIVSGVYFGEPTRISSGVMFLLGGGIALAIARLKSRPPVPNLRNS